MFFNGRVVNQIISLRFYFQDNFESLLNSPQTVYSALIDDGISG